jgi:predicted nucleic acid-binding protein
MKPRPDATVLKWFNEVNREFIWQNAISIYEIQYGLQLLPQGKKRAQLQQSFEQMLREQFSHRVIEFDINAALVASELAASQKLSGRNCDIRDIQIAGIALTRGAYLATRNTKDFDFDGLKIINPFED